MKIVMINDCAFVGETLLRYLPPEWEKMHIRRSRGLWDKTFGVAYKIRKAKGDVFHAHYLLQDCYIAARLNKKPLVGHAHGSDLRTSLNHPVWGRIVRHNLKNCDKILVSTPDILGVAKHFRQDAEYLPNPIDENLFYPKPQPEAGKRRRVLIASDSNWAVKGTDTAIRALSSVKEQVDVSIIQRGKDFDRTTALAASLGLDLKVLPGVLHEKLAEYYWNANIVIDRFTLGSLGMVSLEAIASGRPVLVYASSAYPENEGFPLMDLKEENRIADLISGLPPTLWEDQYRFVKEHHSPKNVESRLQEIYKELIATQ